jgi:hypothetical protein
MPVLRGVEITCTADEALAVARQALRSGARDSERFNRRYVLVDGRRVGVKWLASQLTGLPADAFISREARRVLGQIGVEVRSA